MKRNLWFSWFWVILGFLYFMVPLGATLDFSLRAKRDELSLLAYENALQDPEFLQTFGFSCLMALLTIGMSILLFVPTAYWVRLRLPQLRSLIDFITLIPFGIPAIVLVFGMIRLYSQPIQVLGLEFPAPISSPLILVAGYGVLALPYMYRAVDIGMRSIDVRTLTEAAQSLGAGWPRIIFKVVLPNLMSALLSGSFLTFAIVLGELTLAQFLAWPAFGPYLQRQVANRAYEPAALSLMSFALTWAVIGLIQFIGRRAPGQAQLGGTR